jgi:endonuclease/exonuclease/phosphatase family metal-dependent hydrolase
VPKQEGFLVVEENETKEIIETRLRVLTWNIWWRFGPWERRQPAIVATIKKLDADIITLQEVWGDNAGNLAADLAAELGYYHTFASGMDLRGFKFGNAILSRWPMELSESKMLHGQKETGEGRLALYAKINGPRGHIPIFTTHLNWRFEHSHIRQVQVADLARFVDSKRPWEYPPIVCGDFNAEPVSEEMRMLKGLTTCPTEGLVFHDAWNVAGDGGVGITWDNTNPYVKAELEPDRRIDYILVGWPGSRGAGHVVDCRVTGNEPVDGVWPSDHHAVMAELRY